MKKHVFGFLAVITTMLFGNLVYSEDNNFLDKQHSITQSVEINSQLENIDYTLDAINLGLSIISCGYQCNVANLFSIPRNDEGELVLFFRFKNCPSRGEFRLPFKNQNNMLTTLIPGTYHAFVEGNYCGSSKVDIILSGDPGSITGYHIDLVGKW